MATKSWTDLDKFEDTLDFWDIPVGIRSLFTSKIQCVRFCLKVLLVDVDLGFDIEATWDEIAQQRR